MGEASATPGNLLAPLATGQGVVFLILAIGIVAMSAVCMTRKNPVSAVMSLVAAFFGLAGIYATLSAHFLAVLQVLVYAGAIMVLFIFVVMIVNREETTLVSLRGLPSRVIGVVAGLYLMWVFGSIVIPDQGAGVTLSPVVPPDTFGTVASVGDLLFRQFLFPFESISVLLLVAIVGGVVVSRSARKESDAVLAADKRIAISELSGHDSPAQIEGADDDDHDAHAPAGQAAGGGRH